MRHPASSAYSQSQQKSSQHSNSKQKASYDLQALKKQVGIAPFDQRIHLSHDGFCACPFHQGDSDKSFHVVQKENGIFLGTCFSECGQSFDAIDFVKKFDNVQTGEAIRKLIALVEENGEAPDTVLHKPKPADPMTAELWAKLGRAVTDDDVATLAASRPHSATPSAAALNALGFKIAEYYGPHLVAPYRLGETFYTLKARSLSKKEFIQENSVSQKGLFNIDAVTEGCDVYVVESELDAAILHEHGYIAVSVVNAKQKMLEPEVLKKLTTAYRIFLVGDQDAPGQICMDNLAGLLPAEKVYRMRLPEAKDVERTGRADERHGFQSDMERTCERFHVIVGCSQYSIRRRTVEQTTGMDYRPVPAAQRLSAHDRKIWRSEIADSIVHGRRN